MTAAHGAVIALGSNLGEREATLRSAVRRIGEIDGVTLVAASAIVESPALKPQGVDRDAPAYLNAVVVVRSALGPLELLGALNGIEAEHGRTREEHWGDRTLDLDLIDVDGMTMATERLTLPHPRAAERAFVLEPWLRLQPDAVLTGRGSVAELRAAATDEVLPYAAAPLLPAELPKQGAAS
ncbi:2-amino-4-hydroxy-6-hydroxymethyldihydropteridine diphosphokinase [Homoserinimonas aerilata]|uniref:2-amino-4-hydroxy-6-hydroxymethyldihydropteridine diphosphokinase n=1 Tax=Homoserinimonas aerilata TaxID=1162970 RepID=A0A542Y1U3_9MICO|nr:2-amino-4-hydroxy-6-hydroxymethyldihydropteridine diphosphokinase [Homoserinimonas aerilata]TQL41983.1 2-amino-4-hydroxy-6-hydroxymethyldihydropteridine diphosphokinase [Homoserinimonas aerilata]